MPPTTPPHTPYPIPHTLSGKRITIMGLGQFSGGTTVARYFAQQGACVTVTDLAPQEKLQSSLDQLADLPITFRLGHHDLSDFTTADLIITNPAVDKSQSPFVQAARAAGIPLTTEMNLFLQRNPAYTIAITGSVGKSTTTALIHQALQAALSPPTDHSSFIVHNSSFASSPCSLPPIEDEPSPQTPYPRPHTQLHLGGNIGKSLLLDLPTIRPNDLVVLELSSFMLEETPAIHWSPNLAVITNLFPNHLDRHGNLESYAAAKQNILRFQLPSDAALFNADDPAILPWQNLAHGRRAFYTAKNLPPLPLLMPGSHNQSNARAALAVLDLLPPERFGHLNRAAALHAISNFPGLSHRLQLVHISAVPTSSGKSLEVRWYNDSKATTPEASITALQAFLPDSGSAESSSVSSMLHKEPQTATSFLPGPIFIIGGYDKHIDLSAFENLLARHAFGVLGIGQTGSAMIDRIRTLTPVAGNRVLYVETLDRAIPQAWQWISALAAAGAAALPPVVLSPASASWGQYLNYEKRGEHFTSLSKLCI